MKNVIPLFLILLVSCHSDKLKNRITTINSYHEKAWFFSDSNKMDSSFFYFNKAKEVYLKQVDSVNVAKCLVNMAIISGDQGDYFGSQELSISAIGYLNPKYENQREILSSNYNNLGKMAHLLKKYDEADSFYLKSIQLTNNTKSKNIYLNNIAINLSYQKKYKEALIYFEQLLNDNEIKENHTTFARILSNASKTKWLKDLGYNPVIGFIKALQIRTQENDLWGQNASYAHLADYYVTKRQDSALFYARKMYRVAQKINSPDDRLQALQKLIKLSSPKEAKHYFVIYEKLNDSLQTARALAKNQFALIRYETEKQKADNLVLQKDNAEKKYQLIKQKVLLISGLALAFFAIVVSIVLYKKRKQRLELSAQNVIRENQLRTSKKVHDVVANGLYRVMTEIENNGNLDKDQVLDKLEDMYEKSRDLSYEELHYTDQNFHEKITALLKSFATETTKIVFVGNTEELWKNINAQIKYEIEHILQELMVNMKKHSDASNIAIRFEQKGDKIAIYYADNGVGMLPDQQFKNGLTNTGNRIINIDGEITFDTKVEKGLKIQISFPSS